MTRRSASSSVRALPLACASTLAHGAASGAISLAPVAACEGSPTPAAGRLQELERLDVDEVLVPAHDVRLAHRLEELLGPVEVPQADLDAAQPLRDMAVRAGARNDRVLAGEPDRLLVEGRESDPRIEDLEDVDLVDDLEEVLVVGNRVQPVERMGHVDQAALSPDLGDRLLHRHSPLDSLAQEEADHLTLVCGLHFLGDDHLDPADACGDLLGLERSGD